MAHHAIKRLGPTGLIAIFIALTMSLVGAGAAIAAVGGPNKAKGPVVAHTKAGKMKAPVTGTTVKGDRKVKGTFTPSEFKAVDDALMVTGTLKGKIYGKGAPKAFKQEVTAPVENASVGAPSAGKAVAGCDILNLVLGPLDLNILGLEVHLKRVVLDVVAVAGAGQLLGNLLCAVAGLLDGGPLAGLLGQLSTLLNQIQAALNLGL